MRNSFLKATAFLLAFGVAGCSGSQNATLPGGGSQYDKPMDVLGGPALYINLSLFDAAPVLNGKTVTHFTVGIREVDAIANGQAVPLVSFSSPYMVDLLQYQNGNALSMGQQIAVPAQIYSQLRVVLDQSSTQVAFSDGTTLPGVFKTNSASTSSSGAGSGTSVTPDAAIANSIDVTMNAPFSGGSTGTVSLAADFNVLESIAKVNSNYVTVRPAIFGGNASGQISGTLLNQSGTPVQNAVVAAVGSDGTVGNTAGTDQNGNFNLHALKADTYHLVIYNAYTNAAGQSITASGQSNAAASFNGPSITVSSGAKVAAGTIGD